MNEIYLKDFSSPVPETEEERFRRGRRYALKRKFAGVCTLVFGIVAVLAFLACLILLIVYEFRGDGEHALKIVLLSVSLGCGGGAVVCAVIAFLFGKLAQRADRLDLDFRERCDGEESFFVGEGTLATFEEDVLRIHAETGKETPVLVPYREMRMFSVCTRRAPKEKGEWSVVFEIPVKKKEKKGKYSAGDPPALVQTDGKARLYECIRRHNLELIGALPEQNPPKEKYLRLARYSFPDRAARKRAAMLMILGGVLLAASVPVGIFLNVTQGSLLGVFGMFILGRAGFSFVDAKSTLAFYREGVFWREAKRAERMFLKWEDVIKITFPQEKELPQLAVHCPYGVYRFPDPDGARDFLERNFPDKLQDGKTR